MRVSAYNRAGGEGRVMPVTWQPGPSPHPIRFDSFSGPCRYCAGGEGGLRLGFRKGVGTREAIAALAGLVASSKARKVPLLAAFVDFSKAFDKAPRGLLLRRLREEGVLEYDVLMVHVMYFDVWVRVDGVDREIQEGAGVKQGDPLSPLLFFLFMNTLHRHIRLSAHREDELGREESEKDGTVSDERSIESRTRDYPWAGRLRGVGIRKGNKKTKVAVKRKRGKVRCCSGALIGHRDPLPGEMHAVLDRLKGGIESVL
uniref:Reverse transcriptase domain-containing protein n=1 Tax=Chromera velia CCMP2878 TaxID=1169474 RepID=A0A0G4HZI1_9ALVE|eukprot:Cvel_9743.t1-p1 / transcript=Cvel_9743.t1 / gene=Cvel_9743 / organism=Chromera_velia_CCMP2878 / gene_product=hypothetical protein / transcript_product=hypothetical protein / location=Cvel_scaffold569:64766-71372(-) / protein_length=257 / sequence_SO=supercontig / SO=protein_coding / is_pseudo=false